MCMLFYLISLKLGEDKMNEEAKAFPPIIDNNSRVLILGSVPGQESLRKQQYYAYPRNHFWKIIYSIFNRVPDDNYNKRTSFILQRGIALWDVIKQCERKGSLDSNIKNEEPNDIKQLLKDYQNIKLVVFNGTKAYETYRKNIGFEENSNITFKKMPSTSPIPGRYNKTFEGKLEDWKYITNFLQI